MKALRSSKFDDPRYFRTNAKASAGDSGKQVMMWNGFGLAVTSCKKQIRALEFVAQESRAGATQSMTHGKSVTFQVQHGKGEELLSTRLVASR